MTTQVKDENDLPWIMGGMQELAGWRAEIGVFGDAAEAKVETSEITMEQLAVILHEGCVIKVTPKMRAWLGAHGLWLKQETGTITIPPRPFLDRILDDIEAEVFEELRIAIERIVGAGGSVPGGKAEWEAIARGIVAMIQKSMVDLRDPPNHPFTIAMKGSDNPLIDHGYLLRSVVEAVTPIEVPT